MHYVDEGHGDPIVFVHGMPTWSFLWRAFIADLRLDHRAIAVDHLGFGRSEKPEDADYHPRRLSEDLSGLLEALAVTDATLVVHDFGGPIGLGHVLRHPERVRRIVIFNTWMWSTRDDPGARKVDRIVRGFMGHVMYRWLNASTRWLIPTVLGDGNRLDASTLRAYVEAAPTSPSRTGQLALARNLVGASDWYDSLWERRAALEGKPAQLIWGMQDPTFGSAALARWRALLPHASVLELPKVGHFPQEEATAEALAGLRSFVGSTGPRSDPDT
jgi:haloalkane dehalogenase